MRALASSYAQAKTNLFEGENEYIFEGSVMIIA